MQHRTLRFDGRPRRHGACAGRWSPAAFGGTGARDDRQPRHLQVQRLDATPSIQCFYGAVNAADQDLKKIDVHGPRMWAGTARRWRPDGRVALRHPALGGRRVTALGRRTTQRLGQGDHPRRRGLQVPRPDVDRAPSLECPVAGQARCSGTRPARRRRSRDRSGSWTSTLITYPPNADVHNLIPCLPGQ